MIGDLLLRKIWRVTTESTIQGALRAFTALGGIRGFGAKVGFLGVIACFAIADWGCEAQLWISLERVKKLSGEIARMLDGRESPPAQTQKLVAELSFAQTSVMGSALRPLFGMAMRGGR